MDIQMPLLADVFDVLQRMFPVIVILLTGLAQFMASRNEKKQAAPKRRPAAPPRPANQPPPAAAGKPAGGPNDPLRDEIEDFLRRAQGRPPAQEAKAAPPRSQRPVAERPPARTKPAARTEPAAPQQAPDRPRRPLVQKPPAEPRPAKKPDRPAADSRKKQTEPPVSTLAATPNHLGEEVALADDKFESHLQETFEHNVGSLTHAEATAKSQTTPSPMATELLDLLSKPGGMAQLVIANEILNRPTDRFRSRRRED
ncbi:MAG: hypothetical protein AAGA92_00930 [Planctomycetota bacterium]